MADYQATRDAILQLTTRTGLTLENTLRDVRDRLSPDDWSRVEKLVDMGNFNEEATILEVLTAMQSADASPDND